MKFRKHKIIAFILAVVVIFSLFISNVNATGYTATICQGNTVDVGDCEAFFNWLKQVPNGNSYTINNFGWQHNNGNPSPLPNRATAQNLVDAGALTVLYWSGHGGSNPLQLNVNAPPNQSGNFVTFDLAPTLQVNNSNWANTCVWKNRNLKVAIFAACYILDNTYDECKYLARAMKASNVRVIAGYHLQSPTNDTDTYIVNDFFSNTINSGVSGGESIRSSWQTANEMHSQSAGWAVLCYKSNYNQYYRIPGFPGNTYNPPAADASVYRFWCNYTDPNGGQPIPTASGLKMALPLELRMDDSLIDANFSSLKGSLSKQSVGDLFFVRELNDSGKVAIDEKKLQSLAESFIGKSFNNKALLPNALISVGTVKSEEINAETGTVPNTEVVVGKTFCYNNQYNGILIDDNFIKVGTDADGIYFAINRWKNVESAGQKTTNDISVLPMAKAESAALDSHSNAGVISCSMVYAPSHVNEGVYRLCYKVNLTDGTTSYIDCETGLAVS